MKKLLFLLLFSTGLYAQRVAIVKGVYDADSYGVTIGGVYTVIRLADIDAPEVANKYNKKPAQDFGQAAKDSVKKYLKGKKVLVKIAGIDKYGRTVAKVYVKEGAKNKSLSNIILEKGWGWLNKEYITDKTLIRIGLSKQEKAKKAKLGLWANPDAISPKEYRNQ